MGSVRQLRRHGDQLIWTTLGFQIPEDVKLEKTTVFFQGEQHVHSIKSGLAVGAIHDGRRYLRVIEPVVVDHIEHGEGHIPIGDYWLETKSEYDHLLEESRQVID